MTETIVTREEAVKAAEDFNRCEASIAKIETHIAKKKAELEAKFSEELHGLKEIRDECAQRLEAYVQENMDEVLGDKRSNDFAGLTIGFRKSAKKLVLIGKKKWEHVMKLLQANADLRQQYLRVEEKLDKTELKKADPDTLKKLGLRIHQEDKFFVQIKK